MSPAQSDQSAHARRNKYLFMCETYWQTQSIYSTTAGVKTPLSAFKGLLHQRAGTFISEEYLLNFRQGPANVGFGLGVHGFSQPLIAINIANKQLGERPAGEDNGVVELPAPKRLKGSLSDALLARRSQREFTGTPLSLNALSTLLFHSFGCSGLLDMGPALDLPDLQMAVRTYPSGGALYPIDAYLLALNVRGLATACYKYQPQSHTLCTVAPFSKERMQSLGEFTGVRASAASIAIVFVYRYLKNTRKYGEAGLAFALIETGAMTQNLGLCANSMNLASCDFGGSRKHALERLLGLDGTTEHVVHLSLVGMPK